MAPVVRDGGEEGNGSFVIPTWSTGHTTFMVPLVSSTGPCVDSSEENLVLAPVSSRCSATVSEDQRIKCFTLFAQKVSGRRNVSDSLL